MNSQEKLRIAQVAPLWTAVPPATYGGIELIVSLLTEELARRGHDVTLFASGDSHTSAKLQPVCEYQMLEMMSRGGVGQYEYFANAGLAQALRQAADFDVIHVHSGSANIPFGALSSVPALFTLHTHLVPDEAWVMAQFPGVPTNGVSHHQLHALPEAMKERIPVIYNGCDFATFEPRFEPGKYLAYFGRMSYEKNPRFAIELAQQLGLPIVLAGSPQGQKEQAYYEKEVVPLLGKDGVQYLGAVDHAQKNEFLRNASVLISPLQWAEPFGLVMIEAMACGTPVVARNLGSVAEVIDPGKTGFYSDSLDELAPLIAEATKLDRRQVRAHAEARFGYQKMVDQYLDLYRKL